ncbi:alanine racemase [uncultured Algimonas sp.]|uniref:alanine racemase n=1 Tax=uncultured Algimonas sp. TaxID=1547920 RepID=UPI00262E411A|nr:alanine racemase [uncultured Algimonas sp.]
MDLPAYSTRPTLRVDLARVKANYEALKALTPRAKVAAAVKADAYGLGADSVGRALYGSGCRIFFVATAGEGKRLRDAIGPNAAIYVLNGPAPRDKGALLGAKLKPVINSIDQARYWADISRQVNEPPYTAIHIDTGMNRLGLTADGVRDLSRDTALWKALNPEWVMSHLACASITDHPLNAEQLGRFKAAAASLPPTPLSLANTAGIYLGRSYHFQLVRPGIGLYAAQATDRPDREVTQTAVKLLAPILQIRDVAAGESLGYNSTHTAARDMRVATVGAGYADGVPVSASNAGHAVLHDQPVPIVGRVSMDLTLLDVTDVHLPMNVGGVVELLGERLEALAEEAGTINYELLVRIGQRPRRDYWKPRQGSARQGSDKPGAPANRSKPPQKPRGGGPSARRGPKRPQRSPGR